VTASTTTTIRGVSIFSRQRKRKADVFDIALSPDGIVIQRPGRNEQRMGWERITEWEIEERPGCVVLTLRGGGSVTPLMVTGWTLEDLETVMRDVTEGSPGPDGEDTTPVAAAAPAPVATAVGPGAVVPVPPPDQPVARADVQPDEHQGEAAVSPAVQPRAARRQAARPPRPSVWKPLVTVVLLGVLATAVTVVLLQSAGVINWSFLGPVA
jgi:hypothetical protein